jgi:protein-disulfide isomerase
MTARWPILSTAAVGACASGVAAAVSFAEQVGLTPPELFMHARRWCSLSRLGGIPVEFIALVWFAAVLVLYAPRRPRRQLSRGPTVFVTAVPMAGFGLWQSVAADNLCWPVIVATAAAIAVLVATAVATDEWPVSLLKALRSDLANVVSRPWSRASVSGFLGVSVITGALLHVAAVRVPPGVARDRDLHRWYLNEVSQRMPDWTADDAVRVVVFSDYQCPACADTVPSSVEMAENRRKNGLDIDLVIRDFPLDSKCNAPHLRDVHPVACEAAYAARLVGATRTEEQAAELRAWLYSRGQSLTPELLRARLGDLGLAGEFEQQYSSLRDAVALDVAAARALGVNATPTFIVNGVRLPNGPGVFARTLDYEEHRRSRS